MKHQDANQKQLPTRKTIKTATKPNKIEKLVLLQRKCYLTNIEKTCRYFYKKTKLGLTNKGEYV